MTTDEARTTPQQTPVMSPQFSGLEEEAGEAPEEEPPSFAEEPTPDAAEEEEGKVPLGPRLLPAPGAGAVDPQEPLRLPSVRRDSSAY